MVKKDKKARKEIELWYLARTDAHDGLFDTQSKAPEYFYNGKATIIRGSRVELYSSLTELEKDFFRAAANYKDNEFYVGKIIVYQGSKVKLKKLMQYEEALQI